MAQQNPRLVGRWTIGAGATVELLVSAADANSSQSAWPTQKCNVEIGVTTASSYNIGFGKTTPATNSQWISRLNGASLIFNSISNIGAVATNISADSVWVNNPTGGNITIYAMVTDESV